MDILSYIRIQSGRYIILLNWNSHLFTCIFSIFYTMSYSLFKQRLTRSIELQEKIHRFQDNPKEEASTNPESVHTYHTFHMRRPPNATIINSLMQLLEDGQYMLVIIAKVCNQCMTNYLLKLLCTLSSFWMRTHAFSVHCAQIQAHMDTFMLYTDTKKACM